jgi:hypothetical protein
MAEVKISDDVRLGDKLDGPFLRPAKIQAIAIVDHEAGGQAIAIKATPAADDAAFTKPIVFLVQISDLDTFVEILRTAERLLPNFDGGTA